MSSDGKGKDGRGETGEWKEMRTNRKQRSLSALVCLYESVEQRPYTYFICFAYCIVLYCLVTKSIAFDDSVVHTL